MAALISFGCYWVYMGALVARHHTGQLQSGGGMSHQASTAAHVRPLSMHTNTQVNFFVGMSGLTQLGRIAQLDSSLYFWLIFKLNALQLPLYSS